MVLHLFHIMSGNEEFFSSSIPHSNVKKKIKYYTANMYFD